MLDTHRPIATDHGTALVIHCGQCGQPYRDSTGIRLLCPQGHHILPRELDLTDGETLARHDGYWIIITPTD